MKRLVLILGMVLGLSTALVPVAANATDVYQACTGIASGVSSTVCNSKSDKVNNYIAPIINTILFILGGVSLIVIIIAGLMYVTSAGDASRVKTAKDTLLYAIIGVVVAFLAYAIVNFVLSKFLKFQ